MLVELGAAKGAVASLCVQYQFLRDIHSRRAGV